MASYIGGGEHKRHPSFALADARFGLGFGFNQRIAFKKKKGNYGGGDHTTVQTHCNTNYFLRE